MQILDVTDPARPIASGRYEGVSAPVVEIAAAADRVYLAAGESLIVLDASAPDAPVAAGRYDSQRLPSVRRGLAFTGDHVYIAAGPEGLWTVDVSDSANARIEDHFDTGGNAWNVEIWDGYAYVADEQGGLCVLDVRDPAHLRDLTITDLGGER